MGYCRYLDHRTSILSHQETLADMAIIPRRKQLLSGGLYPMNLLFAFRGLPFVTNMLPRLHMFYGIFSSLRSESKTCDGQCHRRRKKAWERFLQYLKEHGLLEEFKKGFLNLPFGICINMFFLQRIHQVQADSIRNGDNNSKINNEGQQKLSKSQLEEARRMMGYCTTSYGSAVVSAVVWANTASTTPSTEKGRRMSTTRRTSLLFRPAKSQRETLIRFNGLGKYSLEVIADNPSMDTKYTSHFLVLDHSLKEAVLTIRGTFSIADLLTDLDVRTVSFCGGYAAIGFVIMVENIWTLLQSELTTMIPGNYRLIICGHSLGGAVATLLTIKILFEQKISPTAIAGIHCHAFGSPPVFGGKEEILTLYRQHITNYIHQDDTVPFLRPLEVRRANLALCTMDQARSTIAWTLWWRIVFGTTAARNELQEKIDKISVGRVREYGCDCPDYSTPEMLHMNDLKWASHKTVWFRTTNKSKRYQATIHLHAHRSLLLRKGLLATSTMISDHMPIAYENAISRCLKGR